MEERSFTVSLTGLCPNKRFSKSRQGVCVLSNFLFIYCFVQMEEVKLHIPALSLSI